jgi:hypothetical protein
MASSSADGWIAQAVRGRGNRDGICAGHIARRLSGHP